MNIGTAFEFLFEKLYGGKRQKGSGNQWYSKLDIEGKSLLISCKATQADSFRITKSIIREAFDAVSGPGGVGDDYVPLIVVDFVEGKEPTADDPMYALIEMEDLYLLLKEKRELFLETKKEAKHRSASVPSLFRKN